MYEDSDILIKPSRISSRDILREKSREVSCIEISPLEKGMGHTLGNSLRRILLSNILGSAVRAIKIQGINNEYSSIEGVKEDVVEIILNLRKLCVACTNFGDHKIFLKVGKDVQGAVFASQIQTGHGVKILNGDLVLFNVNGGFDVDIEMIVNSGVGYLSSTDGEDFDDVNFIKLDCFYSPIRSVRYEVSNTQFKEKLDYDKLSIFVETNASVSPVDAVKKAARIAQDQFSFLVDFKREENILEGEERTSSSSNLTKNINDLDLSVRALNCLNSMDIKTVKDLIMLTEEEIMSTPNFGVRSLKEIKDVLAEMKLKFRDNSKRNSS